MQKQFKKIDNDLHTGREHDMHQGFINKNDKYKP